MNDVQRRPARSPFPFLDSDLDDVFEGFFRPMRTAGVSRSGALTPAMDVTEHDDRYVVHAELPGFDKDDIHVSLENGRLAIEAEHSTERKEDGEQGRAVVRERRYGRFVRTLDVGRRVDAEAIKASYTDGVLEITLPKLTPQSQEGKRITID
ncbi:MAG: Hsp20/alpha crystallin family protein [Pseudomonadales bacterium]|jgi:HSP20 family protein|nr:Hsp20/alpha crystallin family protein [Pseudomonadales bacterium]